MIDFHTHIFPDRIAASTLRLLKSKCHIPPSFDGTAKGLIDSVETAGLDCAILLPVVTKPSQFSSINRFASQFQDGKLLSFGGIHPDSRNYKEELREIAKMGLKGIKLHPSYQETFIDDIKYKRIIDYASELGLITVVHAGYDPAYPDCTYCTPRRAHTMIHDVRPEKLVLAHLGGLCMWDEVEEYLVGEPVWLDTAAIFHSIQEEQLYRIIRNHGVHKILFATDAPWEDQKTAIRYMERLSGFTQEEKECIFHANAEHLLGRKIADENIHKFSL